MPALIFITFMHFKAGKIVLHSLKTVGRKEGKLFWKAMYPMCLILTKNNKHPGANPRVRNTVR